MRKVVSTHTPSEERVGYSRAVVIDETRIYFSGTTSQDEKGEIIGDDVYSQSKNIFSKITSVVNSEGFKIGDTVLVRAYLVDITQIEGFDKAFGEAFKQTKPACTLVGINQLIDPKMLIEIELIAEKSGK
ncbi:MAG: hypothetical protein A2798_00660 [Candidatus Levybacteria bacterium RIFCSPHIGHO2_01_FULL_37_17]|nr:MAG: hypothetical protein A2798_00660 [Candidatus Levybacteria bacterium RIFCSPHIGHO2_01_FULL_37_17]OGH36966.1 MAG: hypothetical protein A2959_01520 [Candidatus Levybacteria bacterium RIFCSPLOWO2_01_FULL_38_23]